MEIDFLDEEEGNCLIEKRNLQYKNDISGLGPDDCVIVAKQQLDSEDSTPKYYCHTILGLLIKSPESFIEYYNSLVDYQTQQNQKEMKKYKLIGGKFRCYNSFSNEEFTVQIDEDLNIVTNIDKLTDKNFLHFEYSSLLRYYRAPFPLFASIIGGFLYDNRYINIMKPRDISLEEIVYITQHHSISHELQFALAHILIMNLDVKSISKYLHEFEHTNPFLMFYIRQILPENRELCSALYFYLEHHLDYFCDDLTSAIIVSNHYCNRMKIDRCSTFVPLLRSNVWSNPKCAICLGRICTATKKYSDAVGYLNLASIAAGWPTDSGTDLILTKEENRIVKSPLTGTYSDYIDAVIELYVTVGDEIFFNIIDDFSRKHEVEKIRLQTEDLLEYSSDAIACNDQNEMFLFDPGIQSEPSIKNELLDAPFSSGFHELLRIVKQIINQYDKLNKKKVQLNQDHVGNLIVAYRMNDANLMSKIFKAITNSGSVTVADYFVMLKGIMKGILKPTDDVMKTYPYNVNATQRNQLDYARFTVSKVAGLPLLDDNLW
ncbi:hypothetical protein M9Y10_025906 [Tritrichomonas musculus]|uniref:Uncharacterized protein n=1 Tax=Tritrichomonas musculus TaxID=1915356 RepID=A0ABR2H8Z6_9EUKA